MRTRKDSSWGILSLEPLHKGSFLHKDREPRQREPTHSDRDPYGPLGRALFNRMPQAPLIRLPFPCSAFGTPVLRALPAPPNCPLRNPKYHLIETIRPLIEVRWGVYVQLLVQGMWALVNPTSSTLRPII